MAKYDGASAKTNGYRNAAIRGTKFMITGGASEIADRLPDFLKDVGKYVSEQFPDKNPVMGTKKQAAIDEADPQYPKKK